MWISGIDFVPRRNHLSDHFINFTQFNMVTINAIMRVILNIWSLWLKTKVWLSISKNMNSIAHKNLTIKLKSLTTLMNRPPCTWNCNNKNIWTVTFFFIPHKIMSEVIISSFSQESNKAVKINHGTRKLICIQIEHKDAIMTSNSPINQWVFLLTTLIQSVFSPYFLTLDMCLWT